jgi:RNA polymerase sigma-70 factor (sigma-E family)
LRADKCACDVASASRVVMVDAVVRSEMSKREMRDREFEEFAVARTSALYRSAWLLCGDRHAADDLVQETLAKVYAKWHQPLGGGIDNPGAYAHTTLTRTFLSGRRRRGASAEVLYAEPPQMEAADTTASTATRVTVQAALADLSRADQTVVVLRYLEDLSVEETAARMGISNGAVRNRSMRALTRLRERLNHPPQQHTVTNQAVSPAASLCEGAHHA